MGKNKWNQLKSIIKKTPIISGIISYIYAKALKIRFHGSKNYWEERYNKHPDRSFSDFFIFGRCQKGLNSLPNDPQ
jgi:hypothetical protein